jgi:Ni/Fe-hydrogenase subunit HybB-like protein
MSTMTSTRAAEPIAVWRLVAARPWEVLLWVLVLIAVVLTVIRFATGIATIANINQAYPWGWWVGFDMLTRIALGGVGFTMAAAGEIFDIKGFRYVTRAAVLVGLLWYLTYASVLIVELGRPWMLWWVFLSWSPSSAMYEVALCAVAYTTVLVLEFSPLVLTRFGWQTPLRWIRAGYLLIVITGVSLSSLHQSSLGTLLLLVPTKVHPLWHSELLPLFFLLSAIIAGPAVMVVEHILATHLLRLQPRLDVLRSLGRGLTVLIIVYLALRLGDILYRGVAGAALSFGFEARYFWLEILLGLVVPLAILLTPDVHLRRWTLFTAAVCVVAGIVLNRLNVAVLAMKVESWESYRPAAGEVMISIGAMAGMLLAYWYLVRWLPIHTERPLDRAPTTAVATRAVAKVTS